MKFKYIYSLFLLSAMTFASCSDYLDTLPDSRTQLDSEAKVKSLMSSAYSSGSSAIIGELSSDNFIDNGKFLGSHDRMHDELFAWQNSTASLSTQDSPSFFWNACYNAIAHANHALQAIEEIAKENNTPTLQALKAEALLCRAYGHFSLANVFCMAYDKKNADNYPGIPYSTEPETTVSPDYERGTLKETYENIKADIDSAFNIGVVDGVHTIAKYHFGTKSAHAFAARFYLFYGDYDAVISHANQVLGSSPASMMRDYSTIELDEVEYIGNWYIKVSQPCNLLVQTANSAFFRVFGTRYGHGGTASAGCLQGGGPNWSERPPFAKNFYMRNIEYGVIFPKQIEFFEYTDKVAGTGFVHIVHVPFTAEETLLCRAEAYIHKNELSTLALPDLNVWTKSHKITADLTEAQIKGFYVPANTYFYNKLNCNAEDLSADQIAYLQCVLHFRRLETVYDGERWFDLKRYGIEFSHTFDKKVTETLTVNDLRRAIQIPSDVTSAGLPENPRGDAMKKNGAASSSDFVLVK